MPSSRHTPASSQPSPTRSGSRWPLVFNTQALSRSPGSSRTEIRAVPAPVGLGAGMARIPEGSDLDLNVRLESVSEGVLATVMATASLAGECARCLEPLTQTINVRFQELFSYEQDGGNGREDGYPLDGDLLDLEPALRDALVLALPLAPRCAEDCPGLCAECGVRLAQAGPGHRHERVIDPRWAGLRHFMTQERPDGSPVPDTWEENGRGRP
jgi:DUF177 domain-containing protein